MGVTGGLTTDVGTTGGFVTTGGLTTGETTGGLTTGVVGLLTNLSISVAAPAPKAAFFNVLVKVSVDFLGAGTTGFVGNGVIALGTIGVFVVVVLAATGVFVVVLAATGVLAVVVVLAAAGLEVIVLAATGFAAVNVFAAGVLIVDVTARLACGALPAFVCTLATGALPPVVPRGGRATEVKLPKLF